MFRQIAASLAGLLFAVTMLAQTASGADLATPAGPVVLTVHGKIANANRGALDQFEDAFFKFNDVSFDKAAAFDLAMLEKLGMQTLTAKYDAWPKAYKFEGPQLRDVLKAAGAQGSKVKIFAIDGCAAELTKQEIDSGAVLLAVKADDRYLGLGGRGPIWVVIPQGGDAKDDAKLVWSAIRIEVE